jgi:UDP-glucuronate 4-epimerase
MRILVTGTAGFIGYHLIKKLSENQLYEIIGVDNINDYYDRSLKYGRLEDTGIEKSAIKNNLFAQSVKYNNYRFVKLDLTDKKNLNKLFVDVKPNIVVNLAAQAGVRYSLENPESYIASNIVGFLNLLECCRFNPVNHLIYASSSSVYGNNAEIPYSEKTRTDSPASLYAATKKSDELLAYAYSHLYNIPATGLRFFTVYGPYGRPDMAPMIFTYAIYKNKTIRVFNNGDLRRDFTYINDIIEGLIRVIDKVPANVPPHKIYNIGCSSPVKLLDFINMLEEAIGKKALMLMLPMQQGDVCQTYADTSLLEEDIGYKPTTTLKEGIAKFVEWYKKSVRLGALQNSL